jgi:hypothetical protein
LDISKALKMAKDRRLSPLLKDFGKNRRRFITGGFKALLILLFMIVFTLTLPTMFVIAGFFARSFKSKRERLKF